MTEQEEKVGTALAGLITGSVDALPAGHVLAGLRCEVFADADGNVWARGPEGQLVGRVQLVVSPCPA